MHLLLDFQPHSIYDFICYMLLCFVSHVATIIRENGGNVLFDLVFMGCLVLFATIKLLRTKNYVLCTSCEKATTECSQPSESQEHKAHIRRGPNLPQTAALSVPGWCLPLSSVMRTNRLAELNDQLTKTCKHEKRQVPRQLLR